MNSWLNQGDNSREPVFAGKFYPESKYDLSRELFDLFGKAKETTEKNQKPCAIITPHAGYIFSGKVAASAYNQIPQNKNYKTVFVIGSSHQFYFSGASVFRTGNYKTPLGEIQTDKKVIEELLTSSPLFIEKNEAHLHEHGLEVQLPFLQHRLGNKFKLVPIVLGTNKKKECKKIGEILSKWFNEDNLFVISSDFSHYPGYDDASKVDYLTANAICENLPEKLLDVLENNSDLNIKNLATSLCGWTSVLTLLYMTEKKKIIYKKIDYQNSGDAKPHGDKKRVVGYWAIAAYQSSQPFELSENEKSELLNKARSSIIHFLKTGGKGKILSSDSIKLNTVAGAFVSVYVNKELRGCIGGFANDKTLNEMVQSMAVSAACDHRFNNLTFEETENMNLEISVLSPLKKIQSINEIELGKHGIYIKSGHNSGTFLPQVAIKTGWNLKEFLGYCAKDKAGIGWEGWKTADIFIYEAIVFNDKQLL